MDISINENQQNETNNGGTELTEQHCIAIGMRLNGCSYKEIAEHVNRKTQTIRSWFSHSGICFAFYEKERCEARNEHKKHLENLKEEMDGIVSCAVSLVKKSLMEESNSQVALKVLISCGLLQQYRLPTDEKSNELITLLRTSIMQYEKDNKIKSNALDI